MILEDAKKDGIEKTIENRVKEVLSKFVKGLGYKDAQFIVKDSLRL
jgi:thermostable 8-oxoguanine DNA glycosylase